MTVRLPLFPLGTVLYPGLLMPLHIFEERYRELVRDLAAVPEEDRLFGVVAIRAGREVGTDGVRALHDVGCVAHLRQVEAYDDGRFDVMTVGTQRFRLGPLDRSRSYLQADVELLDEPAGDAVAAVAGSVAGVFDSYRSALVDDDGEALPVDPKVLSYLVAASTLLDVIDKQALLEAPDTAARLRQELTLLRRETAMFKLLPSVPAVDLTRTAMSPN
ncbi:MAG: LON peptidase substrate-binding domain-containing protein [Actinomycetes bacterium]